MARRCTTVPGFGICCAAAQRGRIGKEFSFTDSKGHVRCAQCDIIQRTKNRGQGFRFRFLKNAVCQIGPGGCPSLNAQPGAGSVGTIPQITFQQ